jgi:hypothetical protein
MVLALRKKFFRYRQKNSILYYIGVRNSEIQQTGILPTSIAIAVNVPLVPSKKGSSQSKLHFT